MLKTITAVIMIIAEGLSLTKVLLILSAVIRTDQASCSGYPEIGEVILLENGSSMYETVVS